MCLLMFNERLDIFLMIQILKFLLILIGLLTTAISLDGSLTVWRKMLAMFLKTVKGIWDTLNYVYGNKKNTLEFLNLRALFHFPTWGDNCSYLVFNILRYLGWTWYSTTFGDRFENIQAVLIGSCCHQVRVCLDFTLLTLVQGQILVGNSVPSLTVTYSRLWVSTGSIPYVSSPVSGEHSIL